MSHDEKSLILIVDDDLINIEILNAVLEDEYDIIFATNGRQAIELAKKHLPDLVLLDVIMPGMDGYQVCEYLKSDDGTANIPVIFITGLNDMQAEIRGLQVGAIDYVTKPINPPIVQMRVRNHIELQRARNSLKYLAITDGLTDLANRRHFDEVLQNEFNRLSRLHHPLSLIMLDVDFFKKFNDGYGHVVGDNCLKQVAYTIRGSLQRPADFAARYGGEEFACILPNTDLDGALAIAERIRTNIENLDIPHRNSLISDHITVSLGVCTVSSYLETCPSEVITKADQQLYRAKESGRNQICFAQMPKNAD
jgi:diguanylate cyclase (GGDEF)-like protein